MRLISAIKREHYPIPTAENIAARLSGMKYITVMDMKNGNVQVNLSQGQFRLDHFQYIIWEVQVLPPRFWSVISPRSGDLSDIGVYRDDNIIPGSTFLENDHNLCNVREREPK